MIIHGDCLEKLKHLDESSIDAIVTDPPYGWRFMGKAWDDANIMKMAVQGRRPGETYIGADGRERKTRNTTAEAAGKYDQTLKGNLAFKEWTKEWATEALRALKPGGHILIFCGPRTYHAMAMGVEMAGFEIRDQLQWLFGSGFPKSHNIGDGRGTALKPANEPICLGRKPLEKGLTVAANVLKWGTGAINVDGSRIPADLISEDMSRGRKSNGKMGYGGNEGVEVHMNPNPQGRWPANIIFDEEAAAILGEPSRFFYVAKASKSERNRGLEGMPKKSQGAYGEFAGDGRGRQTEHQPTANHHPTVKPIKLMEYLIKLITPPGGIILDPFCGSGSTGVAAKNLGFQFIGIEMNEEYVEIAKRRIEASA